MNISLVFSPNGKWLVWGATDKGHDHDIYDYELYVWEIGNRLILLLVLPIIPETTAAGHLVRTLIL
jgi:hypothetical protein